MKEENLQTKLIESLVEKKFNYWKEKFIKRLKKEIKSEVLLCNCEIAEDRAEEIINNLSGDLK